MDKVLFAETIKRICAKYTTSKTADACCISRNQLYCWIKGKVSKPHDYHIDALADFLNARNESELLGLLRTSLVESDDTHFNNVAGGNAADEDDIIPDVLIDSYTMYLVVSAFPTNDILDYVYAKELYGDDWASKLWIGEPFADKYRRMRFCESRLEHLLFLGIGKDFWLKAVDWFAGNGKYPQAEVVDDTDDDNVVITNVRFRNMPFPLLSAMVDSILEKQSKTDNDPETFSMFKLFMAMNEIRKMQGRNEKGVLLGKHVYDISYYQKNVSGHRLGEYQRNAAKECFVEARDWTHVHRGNIRIVPLFLYKSSGCGGSFYTIRNMLEICEEKDSLLDTIDGKQIAFNVYVKLSESGMEYVEWYNNRREKTNVLTWNYRNDIRSHVYWNDIIGGTT